MSQLLATAIEDFDDGCRYTAFESILFVYGYWSGASILAVGYRSDFWNVFVCVCVFVRCFCSHLSSHATPLMT